MDSAEYVRRTLELDTVLEQVSVQTNVLSIQLHATVRRLIGRSLLKCFIRLGRRLSSGTGGVGRESAAAATAFSCCSLPLPWEMARQKMEPYRSGAASIHILSMFTLS